MHVITTLRLYFVLLTVVNLPFQLGQQIVCLSSPLLLPHPSHIPSSTEQLVSLGLDQRSSFGHLAFFGFLRGTRCSARSLRPRRIRLGARGVQTTHLRGALLVVETKLICASATNTNWGKSQLLQGMPELTFFGRVVVMCARLAFGFEILAFQLLGVGLVDREVALVAICTVVSGRYAMGSILRINWDSLPLSALFRTSL